MKTMAIQEIIVSIKDIVKEYGISQAGLRQLVIEKAGVFLSPATISRVLKDGSENASFNYAQTLEPISRALMAYVVEQKGDKAKEETGELYSGSMLYREAEISELNAKIEQMKAEHEKRCQEYETRLELWQRQIDKKDNRMDHKDKVLSEKDAEIKQLREQLDQRTAELIQLKDQIIAQLMEKKA